jgi:hypothetical protein
MHGWTAGSSLLRASAGVHFDRDSPDWGMPYRGALGPVVRQRLASLASH